MIKPGNILLLFASMTVVPFCTSVAQDEAPNRSYGEFEDDLASDEACQKAKTIRPTLTSRERTAAENFQRNEQRYAQDVGGDYRSLKEIQKMLVDIKQLENLAQSCGIPVGEIDPEKFRELTGNDFG